MKTQKHSNYKAYLYVAPAVILAFLFCWYPALLSFVQSFLKVNISGKVLGFAGFSNFKTLFSDRAFLNSLKVSIKFILLFVPANTFLTLLAASLTRRKSKGSSIAEYIFFAPVAVSLSTYSLIMREIFRGNASVINKITGLNGAWITDPNGAMLTLVLLGIFLDFGIDYILLVCSFRSIDKSVIEAARMDGAGGRRLFYQIELPLIKETVLVTIFLALKDAILISAPIIILTEGGPYRSTETIMYYYYLEAFRSGNRAIQNALSATVLIVAMFFMVLYNKRRINET